MKKGLDRGEKRAQANLLTTVLIIAISIVAVTVVFNLTKTIVTNRSSDIEVGFGSYLAALQGDSDNDGYTDDEEIAAGTNPNDSNDFPSTPPINTPINECGSINESGKYYLVNNVSGLDSKCFDIQVSGVELDCNEYGIFGNGANTLIYTDYANTLIENCYLESAQYGVRSFGDNNHFLNNTFKFTNKAISSSGNGSYIENNHIENSSTGISVQNGLGGVVQNNLIKDTEVGISIIRFEGGLFLNNKIISKNYTECNILCWDFFDEITEEFVTGSCEEQCEELSTRNFLIGGINNQIYCTDYVGEIISGRFQNDINDTLCSDAECNWVEEECVEESIVHYDEGNYSFDIPADWEYDDFGPGAYYSTEDDIIFDIGPIRADVFPTENTLDDRLNALFSELITDSNYNELSIEPLVVDGLNSKRIIFTYYDAGDTYTDPITLKNELILTEDCGGNSYFISYVADDANFDSHKPTFDIVTSSVDWTCN